MAGAAVEVTTNTKEVLGVFAKAQGMLRDMTPLMRIVGEIVRTSVVENFQQGGRPEKWAPLSPVTTRRRKKGGADPLIVEGFAGGLMGSIHADAGKDWALVGTDKIYGAVHQFGAAQGEFGTTSRGAPIPWGNIPARPYLMVQDEDWTEIVDAADKYLDRL